MHWQNVTYALAQVHIERIKSMGVCFRLADLNLCHSKPKLSTHGKDSQKARRDNKKP